MMFSRVARRYFSVFNEIRSFERDTPYNFDTSFDVWKKPDEAFIGDKKLLGDFSSRKFETEKLTEFYIQLINSLIKMDAKKLRPYLEDTLYYKCERDIMDLKNRRVEVCATVDSAELLAEKETDITVKLIGGLRVHNVSLNRKENKYIHEYEVIRQEEFLEYVPKIQENYESMIPNKTKEIQDSLKEIVNKDKPQKTSFSDMFLKVSDTLGLGFKSGSSNFAVPNPAKSAAEMRQRIFKSLVDRPHILVEDYEITSPIGIYLRDLATGEEFGETQKDQSYRHFIRIERAFDAKEAPSIRKTKPFKISDIDFVMIGNPHALVKDFTV